MGFLSDLFGGNSRPATSTNVISQKLPSEIAPFVSQILKEGSATFEAEKAAGYQPYTGDTTARLTAQQEAALTGLEGLAGTQQPFLDEAGQIIRQGADQFTGDVAQQYMSPYQQAVTDIELREADRRFEGTTMPKLEAQAVNMGAMSGLGSRAGVEMAEAQRSQNQLLADIQAKGQQKAYESARQEYGFQKAREGQMAENVAQLGGREVAAGLTELGALKSAGEERQGLAQSALDEAYLKYQQEQQFPKQNLAEFSQLVYGNPLVNMPTTSRTGTDTPYQPSTGQTLLGMGLGAANIYGMSGGFSNAGPSFNTFSQKAFGTKAEGGQVGEGLTSLPVVRRKTPGMSSPFVPMTTSGKPFSIDEDRRPGYEKISDELMDPTTSAERRAQLIGELTSGRMSFTGPSQAATKARNTKREGELSGINVKADNARVAANEEGLTALKRAVNVGDTARKDILDNTLDNKRADLIEGMQARGASRKEIQDALNAMPKRGPGLSTKTGSAQGIGKDITNILDTLRTDVNKQQSLDDTRKRADILALGGMKRADTEKGIAGKSDITTTESAGKERNINRKQQGAELIGKTKAANLISKLSNEQASRLKEFTVRQTGLDKIEKLPEKALAEFIKLEELRLKKEEARTKRLAAGKKTTRLDKSAVPYFKNIKSNLAVGTSFVYDETKDEVTVNGKALTGPQATEWQALVLDAENLFIDSMKGKKTSNENYNSAQRIVNNYIRQKNRIIPPASAITALKADPSQQKKDEFKQLFGSEALKNALGST